MTITLKRSGKSTKNKVVFEETVTEGGGQAVFGSVYIWKWAAEKLPDEFDIELPIKA